MNIINYPQKKYIEIKKQNSGEIKIFSYSFYNPMSWLGILCSVLTNAGLFGIHMFLLSPVMIIYSMINVIPNTSSQAVFVSYLTNYQNKDSFDYYMQMLVPFYHYATGYSSILVYLLFVLEGVFLNKSGLFSSSYPNYTSAMSSFIEYAGTGIWLGMLLGAIGILPVTLVGILTLPLTAPITLWK